MCPLFPASSAKAPATREGKARKGRREPDLLSFRIRLFETNFLGPQGCLNKKHTCGEPTAGVAHTFPGGIQGPGRGVTAHQRAPPEKATGPARLAHPGFGLEHPGNGPKTGKSLNFTYWNIKNWASFVAAQKSASLACSLVRGVGRYGGTTAYIYLSLGGGLSR